MFPLSLSLSSYVLFHSLFEINRKKSLLLFHSLGVDTKKNRIVFKRKFSCYWFSIGFSLKGGTGQLIYLFILTYDEQISRLTRPCWGGGFWLFDSFSVLLLLIFFSGRLFSVFQTSQRILMNWKWIQMLSMAKTNSNPKGNRRCSNSGDDTEPRNRFVLIKCGLSSN